MVSMCEASPPRYRSGEWIRNGVQHGATTRRRGRGAHRRHPAHCWRSRAARPGGASACGGRAGGDARGLHGGKAKTSQQPLCLVVDLARGQNRRRPVAGGRGHVGTAPGCRGGAGRRRGTARPGRGGLARTRESKHDNTCPGKCKRTHAYTNDRPRPGVRADALLSTAHTRGGNEGVAQLLSVLQGPHLCALDSRWNCRGQCGGIGTGQAWRVGRTIEWRRLTCRRRLTV